MTTEHAGPVVRKIQVNTTINGQNMDFLVAPYQSLLETLREILGLTGAKEGCNDGNCGACTVSLDGRIVDSCLAGIHIVDSCTQLQPFHSGAMPICIIGGEGPAQPSDFYTKNYPLAKSFDKQRDLDQ